MLAFSVVSLFLLFLVYGLQAFVLDYFLLSTLSPACWALVAADAMLLLYMLTSYNIDYAASKGGVQWLLYSWLMLAKCVLFYWVVFGHKALNVGLVGSTGIYVVLFFMPVVFLILSSRASRQLHGPLTPTSISVESMLHADMVLHVMIDQIDLVTAFKYCDLPVSVHEQAPWIVTYVGVIIALGLFMHSYSFPAATSALNPAGRDAGRELDESDDVFLTRKHAALVGVLCVDLPLLVARAFLWVKFPQNPGFSPFLVKNIIFLPMQVFRINQCRLAERERAQTSQKAAFQLHNPRGYLPTTALELMDPASANTPSGRSALATLRPDLTGQVGAGGGTAVSAPFSAPTAPTPLIAGGASAVATTTAPAGDASAVGPPENDAVATVRRRHRRAVTVGNEPQPQQQLPRKPLEERASLREQQSSGEDPSQGGQTTGAAAAAPLSASQPWAVTHEHWTTTGTTTKALGTAAFGDATPGGVAEETRKKPGHIQAVVRELKSIREVPVRGFSIWKVLTKILHCARAGGRHGLAMILDDGFVLGYWKQMRLILPLIIMCGAEAAVLVAVQTFEPREAPLHILEGQWHNWKEVPLEIKVHAGIVFGSMLLILLSWVATAPFLDCLYNALLWGVRLTCFYFVCSIARDTRCLEVQDKWKLPIATAHYFQWGLGVLPVVRLLDFLFPIQSALLGRKYIYFLAPAPNRAMEEALLSTVSSFSNADRELLAQSRARCDEFGWVTTSSVLVFLNCRHTIAPVSIGELLIGPDVIKAVRLIDMLVMRGWLELGASAVLFLGVTVLHLDILAVIFFGTRLLMGFWYNIFAQAVRLLALRRYEVKLIFEEIVAAWESIPTPEMLLQQQLDTAASTTVSNNGVAPTLTGPSNEVLRPFLKLRKRKRFLSLLDITEKYERHGFFTSPGSLFPCFI